MSACACAADAPRRKSRPVPVDPADPAFHLRAIVRWARAKRALGMGCAKCDLKRPNALCRCKSVYAEFDAAEQALLALAGMTGKQS